MMSQQVSNILLIGQSGSGKSTCAALLSRKFGKPIILIHGDKQDYSCLVGHLPIKERDLESVSLDKRNTTYILEDLHNISKSQREKVVYLLNYSSRHNFNNCILISHALHSNGLYSLLPFLSHIYLTWDLINVRVLHTLMRYYCYSSQETMEETFKNMPKYHYFHLKPKTLTWNIVDSNLDPLDTQTTQGPTVENECMSSQTINKAVILDYFNHLTDKKQYQLLLDFLINNLPAGWLHWPDLSIHALTYGNKMLKISLIDYLSVTLSPNTLPSVPVKAFHKYLCNQICFPQTLVKNAYLLQMMK
jgi:tRNA uridine 5-carbamoylmethylation protein Kti12